MKTKHVLLSLLLSMTFACTKKHETVSVGMDADKAVTILQKHNMRLDDPRHWQALAEINYAIKYVVIDDQKMLRITYEEKSNLVAGITERYWSPGYHGSKNHVVEKGIDRIEFDESGKPQFIYNVSGNETISANMNVDKAVEILQKHKISVDNKYGNWQIAQPEVGFDRKFAKLSEGKFLIITYNKKSNLVDTIGEAYFPPVYHSKTQSVYKKVEKIEFMVSGEPLLFYAPAEKSQTQSSTAKPKTNPDSK